MQYIYFTYHLPLRVLLLPEGGESMPHGYITNQQHGTLLLLEGGVPEGGGGR